MSFKTLFHNAALLCIDIRRIRPVCVWLLSSNSPCRQVRELFKFAHCRGIRRIHPNQSPGAFERARRARVLICLSLALIQQFALPTGSRTLQVRSLSRHSPYTSKSKPWRFRASSTRPCFDLSVQGSLLTRKKTACLFGQAEESTAQAVISLFIPDCV